MRTSTILLAPAVMTALLLPLTAASAVASTAAAVGDPCADGAGVTVVVDLTDLGGEVQVGCASGDPTTGREALTEAGFTSTDDAAGMICAVADLPDPCPETFDGSYWSYWTAGAGAEWTAYQVGADQSDPVPGAVEGWRYFDGSSGPTVLPTALEATSTEGPSPATADGTEEATPTDTAADPADSGLSTGALATIGVLALLMAAAFVATLRRRRTGGDPAAGA